MKWSLRHETAGMRLALSERFRGLFWTQLLGAFNDNFFKNALVMLLVYKSFGHHNMETEKLSEVAFIIFTVPFFLFSATAGQLADKYDKAFVIQRLKWVELAIGILAGIGFFFESVPLEFCALALLGLQASFFGPLKYGIIPQLLREEDLTEGNAAVETGTKLAILMGTFGGGMVVGLDSVDPTHVKLLCTAIIILVAVFGLLAANKIPPLLASDPGLEVEWNPVTPTIRVMKMARLNRAVFLSILGISWLWALGGSLLTLMPAYGKEVLHVDEGVVNFFQAVFSIGVGVGAVICGKLSRQRVELGLVPFGCLGISVFLADLAMVGAPFHPPDGTLLGTRAFLSNPHGWRIIVDLILVAACSGLYVVPLTTMIQQRTEEAYRSRVIAANNVINAGVMTAAVLLLTKLGDAGLSTMGKFGLMAALNLGVGIYIYTLIPEFFLRFLAFLLNRVLYRLKVVGEEEIPREGGALLVGNHVSFIDWLVVLGGVHRPIRFVMWHTYYHLPLIRYLFRDAGAIPIASGKNHPEILQAAFDAIDQSLAEGRLVCIFPEGQLTEDGEVGEFRKGLERILERRSVPVVPFALQGLWDSLFSRQPDRSPWSRLKRFFRPRIGLVFGKRTPPPPPTSLPGFARDMRERVVELRLDKR